LAAGWLIEEATMAAYWDCYRVPDLSPDDPRVAPLRGGDFASLPPALVHVAEFDPLRDEGEAYAAALTQAGVRAELTVHAGLIHHFYGLGGVAPAAQAAFERVCRGLKLAWAASP
jgi:acetyl esterase/lipase